MDTEMQVVRDILYQNEFFLRRHLVLSRTVLDKLKSEGLITEITRRNILLHPVHRQVPLLLQSIENKGLHSLKKFMHVLRITGHRWIVDSLLDTDVSMAGLKRKSADDDTSLRYRDHYDLELPVPRTKPGDYTHERGTALDRYRGLLDTNSRKSVTAAGPSKVEPTNPGLSLAALLKAREPVDCPDQNTRGVINARTLLANPVSTEPSPYNTGGQFGGYGNAPQQMVYPRQKQDIPITLYGLNQAFANQDHNNQQTLNVLQQEETAIRQLLEQNARDQGQIRRKQAVVEDIVGRLDDIHVRANAIYHPFPHPNLSKYRLAQLNQIPWSSE